MNSEFDNSQNMSGVLSQGLRDDDVDKYTPSGDSIKEKRVFVSPRKVADHGDRAYPDRKSLRQILKAENSPQSLKVLTKRVLSTLNDEFSIGRGELNVNELADRIGVPFKNICNIVSVLSSLGMLTKTNRSRYTWNKEGLSNVLCFYKSLANEFKLGQKLESLIAPCGLYEVINEENNPFKDFFCPRGNLMAAACVKLLMIFLSSNSECLPMHFASCAMWKNKDDEKTRCNVRRRIFDLCGVLEGVGLLKREAREREKERELSTSVRALNQSKCRSVNSQYSAEENAIFYLRWSHHAQPYQIPLFDLGKVEWEVLCDTGPPSRKLRENFGMLRNEFLAGIDVVKRLFAVSSVKQTENVDLKISHGALERSLPLPCATFGYDCRLNPNQHTQLTENTNANINAYTNQPRLGEVNYLDQKRFKGSVDSEKGIRCSSLSQEVTNVASSSSRQFVSNLPPFESISQNCSQSSVASSSIFDSHALNVIGSKALPMTTISADSSLNICPLFQSQGVSPSFTSMGPYILNQGFVPPLNPGHWQLVHGNVNFRHQMGAGVNDLVNQPYCRLLLPNTNTLESIIDRIPSIDTGIGFWATGNSSEAHQGCVVNEMPDFSSFPPPDCQPSEHPQLISECPGINDLETDSLENENVQLIKRQLELSCYETQSSTQNSVSSGVKDDGYHGDDEDNIEDKCVRYNSEQF